MADEEAWMVPSFTDTAFSAFWTVCPHTGPAQWGVLAGSGPPVALRTGSRSHEDAIGSPPSSSHCARVLGRWWTSLWMRMVRRSLVKVLYLMYGFQLSPYLSPGPAFFQHRLIFFSSPPKGLFSYKGQNEQAFLYPTSCTYSLLLAHSHARQRKTDVVVMCTNQASLTEGIDFLLRQRAV